MEFLLTSFYTLLFLLLIRRMSFFHVQGLSKNTIRFFFLVKIGCGTLLWLIYTYYYTDKSTSDIFKFFDDAKCIYSALPQHPLHYLQMVAGVNTDAEYLKPYYAEMNNWYQPWKGARFHDNKIIIQFNALVHLFSFGYYSVHTVFMCFISLTGLTAIYKVFSPFMQDKLKLLGIAVFLIPSVLFWSSGVLKEGILMFALGMVVYHLSNCFSENTNTYRHFLFFLLSAALLLFTKMYVFVALTPALVSFIMVSISGYRHAFIKFAVVHLLFFVLASNAYRIDKKLNIVWYLHQKQMGMIQTAITEKAGSYISINYLKPSAFSVVKNTPNALINTLTRPHLFESKTPFIFISALENLLLFLLLIACVIAFKKPDKKVVPLLLTSLFFVFTLSVLIGLLTPVLGAIVRHRVPIMPFYAISLLLLTDIGKIKNILSAKK